jgi:hypothetical protein
MSVLETTYVSKTNQTNQTNQPTAPPTPPDEYLGVRVTAPHAEWDKICTAGKFTENGYISWAENGKSRTNPHFHVLLPGSGTYSYSDYDTYQDHTLPVLACDFNDDGTKLATASLDKTGLGFRVQF